MGKRRIIFYSIFGGYQLVAFIFTVVIDANTSILFKMASYVPKFKYLSFVGVILIVVDFVWAWRLNNKTKNEADEFRIENDSLKARIYDFQQTKKQTATSGPK
jgi:hypothetical protein